jgi:hypothetical protein
MINGEPIDSCTIIITVSEGSSSGGSSSGGGSTSNVDYTVSGSSTAEANGDYTNTGDTINGYPSYSNGKGYYMLYTPNYGGMWQITNDINASGPPKHSVMSSNALPPTEGWSGVTVTEGGSSGGGSTATIEYYVSGASREEANGGYWRDGEIGGYPRYTNGSCDMVCPTGVYWAIGPVGYSGSGAPYYASMGSVPSTPPTEGWSGVTVAKYAGS